MAVSSEGEDYGNCIVDHGRLSPGFGVTRAKVKRSFPFRNDRFTLFAVIEVLHMFRPLLYLKDMQLLFQLLSLLYPVLLIYLVGLCLGLE
ncbi:hypothetical protein A8990_12091 [Paenibacillus taihuensis]|uniref:Uncharacterized protein n=1 Tax=Paenibacillus taihuensis TaxID=1156355 RepID=A0A3D9RWJ3_9BACL|nr:hypothetical protein A8990_12091 [Paenibacillus taihuensis]